MLVRVLENPDWGYTMVWFTILLLISDADLRSPLAAAEPRPVLISNLIHGLKTLNALKRNRL